MVDRFSGLAIGRQSLAVGVRVGLGYYAAATAVCGGELLPVNPLSKPGIFEL